MSIEYYNLNSHSFFNDTYSVDMSSIYDKFIKNIPNGAHILDAGCGSGRDALYFSQCGYVVTAFDGAKELVKLARKNTGLDIQHLMFDELNYNNQFDAVWASASLLHINFQLLPHILFKFINSIIIDGIFYFSVKYGNKETEKNGRNFTNLNEQRLHEMLSSMDMIKVIDVWVTDDNRPERQNEKWLNVIIKKIS